MKDTKRSNKFAVGDTVVYGDGRKGTVVKVVTDNPRGEYHVRSHALGVVGLYWERDLRAPRNV